MNFSAVILAGGQSSRMGRDKAWLEVDGQALLARQIQLVREAGANEVFISGRADGDYSAFGAVILKDRFTAAGPLAGIESALAAATHSLVLVLAVDMPMMTVGFLRWLGGQCVNKGGVIPQLISTPHDNAVSKHQPLTRPSTFAKATADKSDGERDGVRGASHFEPLVAFYPKAGHALAVELLERAGAMPGAPGARQLAERCVAAGLARYVEVSAEQAKCFANWNTPADVSRACSKSKDCQA